jgi:NitT/TauT family transport system substrate-binding protein
MPKKPAPARSLCSSLGQLAIGCEQYWHRACLRFAKSTIEGRVMKMSCRLFAALLLGLASTVAAQAAEKIVYMNDWLPGGDKALPFYAVQKGLFAKAGLDVTVQTARGSSEGITRIGTGVADVGSGGLTALLQARAEQHVPVKAILSIFTMQPDANFVVEGSGINTLKDLVGKKVATATFTSSNVIWPLVLAANGIDESKVTLIKVDPAALVPMLAAGQADSTINWSTASPAFVVALAGDGRKLKIIPWSQYGFEGYGYSLFASEKMIAERPAALHGFVNAFVEGMKMALADPPDVARAMKTIFPAMDQALVEKQFLTIVPLIDNPITKAEGLGTFQKDRLYKTWEWTAKAQHLALDTIDPETAVDRSFVPK